MTDPEEPVSDREVDVFEPALPVEADEADAMDQMRDVPDAGEEDYPA